jgi:hypothetical protein
MGEPESCTAAGSQLLSKAGIWEHIREAALAPTAAPYA